MAKGNLGYVQVFSCGKLSRESMAKIQGDSHGVLPWKFTLQQLFLPLFWIWSSPISVKLIRVLAVQCGIRPMSKKGHVRIADFKSTVEKSAPLFTISHCNQWDADFKRILTWNLHQNPLPEHTLML